MYKPYNISPLPVQLEELISSAGSIWNQCEVIPKDLWFTLLKIIQFRNYLGTNVTARKKWKGLPFLKDCFVPPPPPPTPLKPVPISKSASKAWVNKNAIGVFVTGIVTGFKGGWQNNPSKMASLSKTSSYKIFLKIFKGYKIKCRWSAYAILEMFEMLFTLLNAF